MEADDLEKMCDLGRGAYGVVEKMKHIPSGTVMAVKVSFATFIVLRICSILPIKNIAYEV